MSTVVITGASRGIGLAFVKHYLAEGWQVVALCRKTTEELVATRAEIIEGIDVSSNDFGSALRDRLADVAVDVLINNAGILRDEVLDKLNFTTMREQFEVNALGPLKVVEALMPNMREGSKIALITSRMGSITDNTSGGRYGYRMSKAALNIAGVSLAQDLRQNGIAVGILHPGYVQTDMVGNSGDISATVAAERLANRIADLTLDNSGTFWHSNGEVLPW